MEKNNREEAKEVVIIIQQSITHNRWRGIGAIFNLPIAYQVLEPIKEDAMITIARINVDEVNGLLTNDGI